MNIAFYTLSPVNPHIGGIERVTYNLSESFRKRGLGVYNICSRGKEDESHFILPSKDINNAIEFVNQIIDRYNIDVIIDQYGRSDVLSHKYLKAGVRIIRCIHCDVEERNMTRRLLGNFWFTPFKQKLWNFLFWLNTPFRKRRNHEDLRRSLVFIDKLVVLSPAYIGDLKKRGLVSEKIISIPNGTTTGPDENDLKRNIILFCGRVIHNPKNVFFLLKLWKELQKYKDWEMIIAGGGEDLERLKQLAKRYLLQRILFPGYVDPSAYYKEAKILLLPSMSEGFPMILLEGMTQKCVPIVFDTSPAFRDIIEDGFNGFIVQGLDQKSFFNKCETLMTQPELLDRMADNAKSYIDKKYSLEVITDMWLSLFNELRVNNRSH